MIPRYIIARSRVLLVITQRAIPAGARCLSVQSAPTSSSDSTIASGVAAGGFDDQQHLHRSQQLRHLHPLQRRLNENQDEDLINDLAYCLSFAMDESDFDRNLPQLFSATGGLDARMKQQLAVSNNQLRSSRTAIQKNRSTTATPPPVPADNDAPLPRTLEDALRPSHRAIVITEAVAPFRVLDVNRAWENLCGYTHVESKGRTLGSLLRGPETNQLAATALIAQLLRGEEAGALLTNYTKSGRRFRNRLRAGPLYGDGDRGGRAQYFVGVLQEIHDGQ